MASRHLARALVLQTLFECDLTGTIDTTRSKEVLKRTAGEYPLGDSDMKFATSLLDGVTQKIDEIDQVMAKAAPQWPVDKIAPIDRNVLRIGLYELLFGDRTDVPPKVALNEAIEIGKSFGGDASGKFVNGVLGAVYREIGEPQKFDAPKTTTQEHLGGAVVMCGKGADMQVALIHDAFHHWTLPKSKCAAGEVSLAAAERAALEELGVAAVSLTPLNEHSYTAHHPQKGAVLRTVSYFFGAIDKANTLKCKVCEGITDVRWWPVDKIADIPIYPDVRKIISLGIEHAQKS